MSYSSPVHPRVRSSRFDRTNDGRSPVQRYFDDVKKLSTAGDWRALPEIPTAEELQLPVHDLFALLNIQSDDSVQLNRLHDQDCKWRSRDEYLKAQFVFCREESTFALRSAIAMLKNSPRAHEPDLRGACSGIGIYDKARVTGIKSAATVIATRISFSTDRSRVNIDWTTTSRLKTGSLIAMTPADDNFSTRTIPGIVVARPLALINKTPPEVEIFFPHDVVYDPSIEYVIVEETTGYFEAQRHNMVALQKMTQESFPLSEYLLKPRSRSKVDIPASLGGSLGLTSPVHVSAARATPERALMDLSPALGVTTNQFTGPEYIGQYTGPDYTNVDIRSDWPHDDGLVDQKMLDVSQMEALKHMLSTELSLIQGPPGTGKTHVSVSALAVLLNQIGDDESPVIVACQTNHALDQLLSHVAKFNTNFIRLGGRTADQDIIKSRTLHEVRQSLGVRKSAAAHKARATQRKLTNEIFALLKPFDPENGIFDHHVFKAHGIISEAQFDSIEQNRHNWSNLIADSHNTSLPNSPLTSWLGNNLHELYERTPLSLSFTNTEESLDEEELDEIALHKIVQDDATESLKGQFLPLAQRWTMPDHVSDQGMSHLRRLLNSTAVADLTIPSPAVRCAFYKAMVAACKEKIAEKLQLLVRQFDNAALVTRISNVESDLRLVKKASLLGMTTTGVSKNRALVAATRARVVMLEEAGESLECTVAPLLLPTIEQFIQVGDHKQLRPRPQKHAHEDLGWGVSMFERLIVLGVEMRMLQRQRRMVWEVSRLLRPVYGSSLKDSEDVDARPAVLGMGGYNTWFLDHPARESRDAQNSVYNEGEASLVVEFAAYLARNGAPSGKISILTFYNGQKRLLQRSLRQHPFLRQFPQIGVYTVDSYQGEENEVILLSLVRSNEAGNVGFVSNPNRVNVALSRARNGLFMFGNRGLLEQHGGKTWREIFKILDDRGAASTRISGRDDEFSLRIGAQLSLVCCCGVPGHETDPQACWRCCRRSHDPVTTEVTSAEEIAALNGGCGLECEQIMPCGHQCPLTCHPWPHSEVICNVRCRKILGCGHVCAETCKDPCVCDICPQPGDAGRPKGNTAPHNLVSVPASRPSPAKLTSVVTASEENDPSLFVDQSIPDAESS